MSHLVPSSEFRHDKVINYKRKQSGSGAGKRVGLVRFLQVSHLFADIPPAVNTKFGGWGWNVCHKWLYLQNIFCLIPKEVAESNYNPSPEAKPRNGAQPRCVNQQNPTSEFMK